MYYQYAKGTMNQSNKIRNQNMQTGMQDIFYFNSANILLSDTQLGEDNKYVDESQNTKPKIRNLEKIEPYVTSYVCLLVPRFEEHLLTGDVTDNLRNWMINICISFGWQLKFIDIRPQYLHWIMAVSIATYPTHFMRIVRKESSTKIFDDFPRFKQKNLSNDFWAPWYFVGVGEVPYSQSTIQTYIEQIRLEQGLL